MKHRIFGRGNNVNHYRVVAQMQLVANQAVGSRLFEMRNPSGSAKLLVIERVLVTMIQNNNHTAALIGQVVMKRATGFTVLDSVNTSTPVANEKRTGMSTVPGVAQLRALTFAGNSAGITGGTLAAIGSTFGIAPCWFLATLPTAGPVPMVQSEMVVQGAEYPPIIGADEGLIFENNVLFGAAGGAIVSIEVDWSELTA